MKSNHLAVHRYGQGDPVIFLHGFFSDHRLWEPIIQTLSSDYQCLAVDLPGHGESGPWRGDWPDLLEQLDHLIASLSVPCHLIGYSMGARVLGQMLTRLGPPIHTAILISPTAGFQPIAARQRRLRDHQLAAQINHQTITESADYWSQQPIFYGQDMSSESALQRQHRIRCSQEPNRRGGDRAVPTRKNKERQTHERSGFPASLKSRHST